MILDTFKTINLIDKPKLIKSLSALIEGGMCILFGGGSLKSVKCHKCRVYPIRKVDLRSFFWTNIRSRMPEGHTVPLGRPDIYTDVV